MRTIEPIETAENDKQVIQAEIKKNIKFIGGFKKIKGLKLFEFNAKNFTLEEAKYKESAVKIGEGEVIHHKVIYKEDCVYIQALNKKNAYKKIAKSYHQFKNSK